MCKKQGIAQLKVNPALQRCSQHSHRQPSARCFTPVAAGIAASQVFIRKKVLFLTLFKSSCLKRKRQLTAMPHYCPPTGTACSQLCQGGSRKEPWMQRVFSIGREATGPAAHQNRLRHSAERKAGRGSAGMAPQTPRQTLRL